jgi:photosystem II stability/assembly factor-like uncharacterized protein
MYFRRIALLFFAVFLATVAASAAADTTLDFQAIHFVDHLNAWAESQTGFLRTTDGGRTWKSLLPAPGFDGGHGIACRSIDLGFLDISRAWVAYIQTEGAAVFFRRTLDGGAHWTGNIFTPAQSAQGLSQSTLTVLDDRNGWLMIVPERGMNSSPGYLYRTKDGGETWTQIAGTGDRLPRGGAIYFRDASVGFLVGSDTTTDDCCSLSVTRDGGVTWQLQQLPLPRGLPDGDLGPSALPIFFGDQKKEGVLAADYMHQTESEGVDISYTVVYTTHDGGNTWRPATPVKDAGGIVDFVDAMDGWIWNGGGNMPGKNYPVNGTLRKTEDGGQTWLTIEHDSVLRDCLACGWNIVQLDFVDRDFGWAYLRSGDAQSGCVLQTRDGGKTWGILSSRAQP